MENMSVKVLFRKFKSGYFAGDIIAFLIDGCTGTATEVACYEHIGQHGLADITCLVELTEDATPTEYAGLFDEMENLIGYKLTVMDYPGFMAALWNQ